MIPSYEECLQSAMTWKGAHKSITYNISFHSYRNEKNSLYNSPGIWNYYIFIDERMLSPKDHEIFFGEGVDWYNLPDLDLHGGCTFFEIKKQENFKRDKSWKVLKVGCDYAHYWDEEYRHSYSKDYVERDAKHSINVFLKGLTDPKIQCTYTGDFFALEEMYECVGGFYVNKTSWENDVPEGWKESGYALVKKDVDNV